MKTGLDVDLVQVIAEFWLVGRRRLVRVLVVRVTPTKHVLFSDGLRLGVLEVAVGEGHGGLEPGLLDTGEAVAIGLFTGFIFRHLARDLHFDYYVTRRQ